MEKIEFALKLAKDCTYADIMTEGAKEHLRNKIDEALKELKQQQAVNYLKDNDISESFLKPKEDDKI